MNNISTSSPVGQDRWTNNDGEVQNQPRQGQIPPRPCDRIQWTINGVDQFRSPKEVTRIDTHNGDRFCFVDGVATGIPIDQVAIVNPVPPKSTGCRAAAQDLLDLGFWPVPNYSPGVKRKKGAITNGKEPFGTGWGLKRWTRKQIDKVFYDSPPYGVGAHGGVGVGIGPDRAPGGLWLADFEGDGPKAADSLATLLGGEIPHTPSWSSTRGGHTLFTVDGDRLLTLLQAAGATEGKQEKAGVWHLADLPDLELRVGGYTDERKVKQVQCVAPPTVGTDGNPREWRVAQDVPIAILSETAYVYLEALVRCREIESAAGRGDDTEEKAWPSLIVSTKTRAEAYVEGAILGTAKRVAALPRGHCHFGLLRESLVIMGITKGAGEPFVARAREALLQANRDNGHAEKDPGDGEEVIKWGEERATPRLLPESTKAPSTNVVHKPKPTPIPMPEMDPFQNWDWEESKESESEGEEQPKRRKAPLMIQTIGAELGRLQPGWPKRVNEQLFIQSADYRPVYLGSAPRLFAWIDRLTMVDWTKGSNFITQERFYEHLRMTAEEYDAIENLPHWPPIPKIYYMHPAVNPGDGTHLDRLLDYFTPATDQDRQFIKSLILTLFWGGAPGQRPAFLVTGPDNDPELGRGIGKSTLIDILSEELGGGYVNVSPEDQMSDVVTRLLSNESGRKRVARLDNVKTHRLSWADLEGLITSSVISGHSMYRGEGRRPNTLVWMITLNGASLSKDMAQRVIVIKVGRPRYAGEWEGNVRKFIQSHKQEILGDIREVLEQEPYAFQPALRWATWSRDVLSKLGGCLELEDEIVARQASIDDDQDEKNVVIEFIREKLEENRHNPDHDAVLIPSATMAGWIIEATRKRFSTNQASTFLKGLAIANLSKSDRKGQRFWLWTGAKAAGKTPAPLIDPWGMTVPGSTGSGGGSDAGRPSLVARAAY